MSKTSIEWCDHSINPLRARAEGPGHYCEKISPGCANCYASRLQPRFGLQPFEFRRRAGAQVVLHEPALEEVLTRRKPTRYFWCDMTDLFGEWVPDAFIDRIFAAMALTPQHTHMVLTKRADRMRAYFEKIGLRQELIGIEAERMSGFDRSGVDGLSPRWRLPLPNVWLGVSGEDQANADVRIPLLLQTPAAVRFVSAEPLLGPIDFHSPVLEADSDGYLDWVIVGGESGPDARQCEEEWIRTIVQQCVSAGVSVFVKQLGSKPANSQKLYVNHPRFIDRKGGDPLEWPDDLRVREFPAVRS